jgi:hypothetical protein
MAKKNKQRDRRPDLGGGIRVPEQDRLASSRSSSSTLTADVDGGKLLRDTDNMGRQDYLERHEELRSQVQKGWLPRWKDIRANLLPERGLFDGETANSGLVDFSKVMDIRIRKFMGNLATMLQGGFSSPAKPWFRLAVPDAVLNGRHAVKVYLAACEKIMYQALRRSNFYDAIHSVYLEALGFGTSVIYGEEDFDRLLTFRTFTIGEYLLDTNHAGKVDTLYRVRNMTARQMAQKFGEKRLSVSVQKSFKDTPGANHRVLHVIAPRKDFDRSKIDNTNMPFKSIWLELDGTPEKNAWLLGQGGYMEQPFMAPRWDVIGSNVYGVGPGWYALPEVKTLYEARGDFIKAVHKVIDPPMLVPTEYRDRLVHLPGGQSYGDEQVKPLYQINPDLVNMNAFLEDSRSAIEGEFFNDVFIFLLNNSGITATEINARVEEKARLLGPALERLENDLFDLLIGRSFAVLNRSGKLPPAPDELRGVELRIEYISELASMQKEYGTRSIQKTITFGLELSKFDQSLVKKMDLGKALDEFHDLTGSPPSIVRPEEEYQALLAQEQAALAAQAKAQHQLEMAKVLPQAAQTLSQTPVGAGGNALDSIMGAGNPVQTEPLGPPAGPRPFGLPG